MTENAVVKKLRLLRDAMFCGHHPDSTECPIEIISLAETQARVVGEARAPDQLDEK